MHIDLGARITLSDGTDAGSLQWVVLDLQINRVTHLVLATDPDGDPDFLVPLEEVESVTADGGAVALRIGPDELPRLPTTVVAGTGQIAVGRGAAVVDAGGENVGVAEEVLFEKQTGALRGFVLRVGDPVRTLLGGGERAVAAAHHVARVGESTIHLRVGRHQLPALTRLASGMSNAD